MIYRIQYDWHSTTERGECYHFWTVGETYPLWEFSPFRDEVTKIEVKGTLANRIALISFKKGAEIEQHNVHTIITLTEDDYRSDDESKGKKAG